MSYYILLSKFTFVKKFETTLYFPNGAENCQAISIDIQQITSNESVLILLSGPTSVGRTSIVKALQKIGSQYDRQILHIEADNFMPSLYLETLWKDRQIKIRIVAGAMRATCELWAKKLSERISLNGKSGTEG